MADFHADGAVELYYDNSRKLRTTSTGIAVEDHIDMDDNHKLRLGSSSDLQIYHDGSASYIQDSGTGALIVDASELRVNNAADTENLLQAFENGSVILYYDNSEKIRTTSSGLRINDSTYLYFGTGEDMWMGHNGSNSYISNGTGNLNIRTGGTLWIDNAGGSETYIKAVENGAVQLYYDNSQKLTTSSTGVEVSGNVHVNDNDQFTAGNSADLKLFHNGSDSCIQNTTGAFFFMVVVELFI